MMNIGGKRGQVGIFVILAVVIVVVIALIYFIFPGVRTVFNRDISPNSFVRDCVQEEIKNDVKLLAEQGGYADPEGFILYKGKKLKYLCYTSEYYLPCKVQQPLIKRHFEMELRNLIEAKSDACVQELRTSYEDRGYVVSGVEESTAQAEIAPEKVRVVVNAPMTITKGEETQRFTSFTVDISSKIYDLIFISVSIVDFESTYGDAETTLYYRYYPNLLIEKNKLGDGTTAYSVQDVTSKEEFNFASRSLAWPGGYGLDG